MGKWALVHVVNRMPSTVHAEKIGPLAKTYQTTALMPDWPRARAGTSFPPVCSGTPTVLRSPLAMIQWRRRC